MSSTIKIRNRIIGEGHPTYMIAEMSANHAGSKQHALEIIHAARESGADCIKIQTYTADTLTIDCHNRYFAINDGTWKGENLYSLYQKAYTPWEWQAELKEEAEKLGLDFFSTPFDHTSVDFLEEMGMEFYKIASFELVDIPLIKYVASKGKPIIMSTGMGSLEEVEEAVAAVRSTGNDQLALLKCSSAYPAITDEMKLSVMTDMRKRFHVPTGLSDHSLGSLGAVTAVAMGASIIEKHFCLDRRLKNPDSTFSMEPQEYAAMVRDIRLVEKAAGQPIYGPEQSELGNMAFRRSIFVVKDIKAGEKLTPENIRVIRPSNGLKPKYYEEVLGRTAKCDIGFGTPLSWDVIEEA